jgi:hypothetical protein
MEIGTRPDALERARELDQFNRAAEEYLRAVRLYLHEPLESEVCLPCRNESEQLQVANQLMVYHLRYLRQCCREPSRLAEPADEA